MSPAQVEVVRVVTTLAMQFAVDLFSRKRIFVRGQIQHPPPVGFGVLRREGVRNMD